jgi:hypothetical protein
VFKTGTELLVIFFEIAEFERIAVDALFGLIKSAWLGSILSERENGRGRKKRN